MRSRWTHSICYVCWRLRNPNREPVLMREQDRQTEICCYCLAKHASGIFVREDPEIVTCGGRHDDAAESN